MPVTEVMSVAEFGMQYQKMRIDAATINIANSNVVQPPDGSGFKPLQAVIDGDFSQRLLTPESVQFRHLNIDDKQVYRPDHPAADNAGYIHFPNIDMATQMVTLTEATRAYEANVKAFNHQMNMTTTALEIGK